MVKAKALIYVFLCTRRLTFKDLKKRVSLETAQQIKSTLFERLHKHIGMWHAEEHRSHLVTAALINSGSENHYLLIAITFTHLLRSPYGNYLHNSLKLGKI